MNRRVEVWQGRYGALYFGVAVLVLDRLGKAGMLRLVAVRFVLERRVYAVHEGACYVLLCFGRCGGLCSVNPWPGEAGFGKA